MSALDSWLALDLDEDRRMVLDMVADLTEGVVAPAAADIDAADALPDAVNAALAGSGLFGMALPEDLGGLDAGPLCLALSIAELARGSAGAALTLMTQVSLVQGVLVDAGAEGAAGELLEGLADGSRMGAFAHAELSAAAGADGVETALEDGRLDGLKSAVLCADRADAFLVSAREGEGLSLFLVPRDAEGLTLGPRHERMGMRGTGVHDVRLEGVAVTDALRVGEPGAAASLIEAALDRGRLGVTALACGIIRAARDHAARYATERRQFDRPISDFEAIRERLAGIESGGAASYALLAAAAGVMAAKRSARQICELAKIVASEAAMKAADDAVQVYGGYGYSQEYPVERLYRDARWLAIAFGGNDLSRVRVAARILPS